MSPGSLPSSLILLPLPLTRVSLATVVFMSDFFLNNKSSLVNVMREITTDNKTIVTPATSGVVKKEFKLTRASTRRKKTNKVKETGIT